MPPSFAQAGGIFMPSKSSPNVDHLEPPAKGQKRW